MKRRKRFQVGIGEALMISVQDKQCGNSFWSTWAFTDWGELEDAIAKHERECLPLPEEETNGNEGKDHNPAQSTGPAESELRGIDPGGGLDNWDF